MGGEKRRGRGASEKEEGGGGGVMKGCWRSGRNTEVRMESWEGDGKEGLREGAAEREGSEGGECK